MKTLYLYRLGDRCIAHDGYIQIGIHSHSIERHRELNPTIEWMEVHWIPDVFKNRYKRVTFQRTQACNEGSPSTDNAGQGVDFSTEETTPRPRDFPGE